MLPISSARPTSFGNPSARPEARGASSAQHAAAAANDVSGAGMPTAQQWNRTLPPGLSVPVGQIYTAAATAVRTGAKMHLLNQWKGLIVSKVLGQHGGAATHEEFVKKAVGVIVTEVAQNPNAKLHMGKEFYNVVKNSGRFITPRQLAALLQTPVRQATQQSTSQLPASLDLPNPMPAVGYAPVRNGSPPPLVTSEDLASYYGDISAV